MEKQQVEIIVLVVNRDALLLGQKRHVAAKLQDGVSHVGDERFFTERLTVLNDSVAWDLSGRYDPGDCIDIDPFEVYAAPSVADPLESAG